MDHIAQPKIRPDNAKIGAKTASLGNTAKSSSTLGKAKRAERYAALSSARVWLGRHASKIDEKANPGDLFRTHDCKWARIASQVEVWHSPEFESAVYKNIATCASVWACPVCCSVIQQRRRPELQSLIEWAYRTDYRPAMVTFTFPHTRFDSLADLISKQRQAFKILRSGRAWQEFKQRWGFQGLVRSLELTHGKNGWHPHTHELWITRFISPVEEGRFREFIVDAWVNACWKVGLLDKADKSQFHAFQIRAVDVRHNATGSDYLAKQDSGRAWGVDREIATSSSKAGKGSGVHPHEFLIRQEKGDYSRYIEYVTAMKGARQLFWSPGLKLRVGIADVIDDVLSLETSTRCDYLGFLTPEQWRLVRGNDARAELLDAAENGGWASVQLLLQSLGG